MPRVAYPRKLLLADLFPDSSLGLLLETNKSERSRYL
jgi:hypothetical protein